MKKFQAYVNEQLDPKDLINYKNYIFNQGIFSTDELVLFPWQSTSNFSDGTNFIKPRKQGIVFQFIQGVPVISVPVKPELSGNVVIDNIYDFVNQPDVFDEFQKYVNVKDAIK